MPLAKLLPVDFVDVRHVQVDHDDMATFFVSSAHAAAHSHYARDTALRGRLARHSGSLSETATARPLFANSVKADGCDHPRSWTHGGWHIRMGAYAGHICNLGLDALQRRLHRHSLGVIMDLGPWTQRSPPPHFRCRHPARAGSGCGRTKLAAAVRLARVGRHSRAGGSWLLAVAVQQHLALWRPWPGEGASGV